MSTDHDMPTHNSKEITEDTVSEPCLLCVGKVPNAATLQAFAEIESGQVKRFNSVEALMADLNTDDYGQFLHNKVDAARASLCADLGRSNDDVEADFAARRTNAINHS
jgi:hypothetical protein